MDSDAWNCIAGILSTVDHTRRPNANHDEDDPLGVLHVLLFGDFKQLPPATSKPPFIVVPWVVKCFDFRVLRQNRRIVAGTEDRREDCAWHTPCNVCQPAHALPGGRAESVRG